MKIAEDFRRIARNALMNKWLIAVLVGLVASLLGGLASEGPQVKINIDASNADVSFSFAGQNIFSTGGGLNSDIAAFIAGAFFFFIIIALVLGVIYFILGSFVGVGYAKFNLNLIDRKETAFETLFEYFSYWRTTAAMRFFRGLFVLLGTLLFIIPGIVIGYSYAMTDFILAENPNITGMETLELSQSMMKGNRWRFFCLQFSFIGWDILATLAFGIGHLWLTPYKRAAYAAFYREVSGTEFYYEETEMNTNY